MITIINFMYILPHKNFFLIKWRMLENSDRECSRYAVRWTEGSGKIWEGGGLGARVLNWGRVGGEKNIFVRKLVQEEKKNIRNSRKKTAIQKAKCNHSVSVFFIKQMPFIDSTEGGGVGCGAPHGPNPRPPVVLGVKLLASPVDSSRSSSPGVALERGRPSSSCPLECVIRRERITQRVTRKLRLASFLK